VASLAHYSHLTISSLKILYLNARSIASKVPELAVLVKRKDYDLISITETWLSSANSDVSIAIPNYSIIRADRDGNQRGGGVAVYVKNTLDVKRRQDLMVSEAESLVLEVNNGNRKLNIVSIYRPPAGNIQTFLSSLEGLLINGIDRRESLLLGDYNIDLMAPNSAGSVMAKLVISGANFQQLVKSPTRIAESENRVSKTMIDWVLSNQHNKVKNLKVLSNVGFSDHSPIELLYLAQIPKQITTTHLKPNYCAANIDMFINRFSEEIDMSAVTNCTEAFQTIDSRITTLARQCFPLKKYTTRPKDLPLFSEEIKHEIAVKYAILKEKRRAPFDTEIRQRFNIQSNKVRQLSNRFRRKAVNDKISSMLTDSKKLWSFLFELLPIKPPRSSNLPLKIDVDDRVVTDAATIANAFNVHFTSVGEKLAAALPPAITDPISYMSMPPLDHEFNFRDVQPNEVDNFLKQQSSGKATFDACPFRIIKRVIAFLVLPLTIAINLSFGESTVPAKLKCAKVTALHKSGTKSLVTNYRPISILPLATKVLEHMAQTQLLNFFTTHGLLTACQNAYRSMHSCEQTLIHLISRISSELNRGKSTVVVFIDLAKAFDTIDHNILLRKLSHYGVRNRSLAWFRDLLSNRTQLVQNGNIKSAALPIRMGIPQGSSLGPLLFNIYINDLPNFSNIPETLQFADDTALVFTGEQASPERINQCLAQLSSWMVANRLTLNVRKTKFIRFCAHGNTVDAPEILINGERIELVENYKYLGVELDHKLSFKSHISSVVSRLNQLRGIIYANRRLLTIPICAKLIDTLAMPVINFCDTIYGNASSTSLQQLDVAYRNLLKTAYRLRIHHSTATVYKTTNHLPLMLYRQIGKANMALRSLLFLCAPYLHNIVRRLPADQRRRLPRDAAPPPPTYAVVQPRIAYGEQVFSYWAPVILNHVPQNFIENCRTKQNPIKWFSTVYKNFLTNKFNDIPFWDKNLEKIKLLF
jgi:hypothetical protein